MPKVMYKTKDGMKTKMCPYNKSGVDKAKSFAKLVNGKVEMSMKNSKMKYAKKTQKS